MMDYVLPGTVMVVFLLCAGFSSGIIYPTITPPDKDLYRLGSRTFVMFNNIDATFNEARSICKEHGGDLAKINSQESMNALKQTIRDTYGGIKDFFNDQYYIGVYRSSSSTYHWVSDCTAVTYDVILNHDTDSGDCLLMPVDDSDTLAVPCDTSKKFLCEIYKSDPCTYLSRMTGLISSQYYGWYNSSACESACDVNPHCWGIVQIPFSSQCELLVDDGPPSNSFKVTTKSCIDVATNAVSEYRASSIVTDHDCTAPVPAYATSTNNPTQYATREPVTCPTMTVDQPPVTVTVPADLPCPDVTVTVSPTTVYVDNYITVTTAQPDTHTVMLTSSEVLTALSTHTSCVTTLSVSTTSVPIEVIESVAEEIVKNLTVDVKSTSAYTRTLVSADDQRRSSQYIGVFGVLFVVVPLSVIILTDLSKIVRHVRFGPGNTKDVKQTVDEMKI